MTKNISIISLLLLFAITLTSCSDSEEQKTSTLEEKQKQMAQEMVKNIQDPLEKANLAKELSEDHLRRTEEAVPKQ